MPAIDFNTSGNVVIPFYDRREDGQNRLYHQYYAYVDANGTSLQSNQRISSFMSNPAHHSNLFIGDYQDAWDWTYSDGESATSAWIGIQSATIIGDVFLSRIFY